jgi:hypothetical protein
MQNVWALLNRIWAWLNLPPVGHETALHIDLATAFIALLALIFSIWTWRHQTRISIEAMRIERDNDLIRWIDAVIDTIVEVEFFLRGWTATVDAAQLSIQRDGHLAKVAAAIDKGRLYFPNFTRDVIASEGVPPSPKSGLVLLDDLVDIYDLIKGIDLHAETAVKAARQELMKKKRHFVISAQNEIEPDRRLLSAKRRYGRSSQGPHR